MTSNRHGLSFVFGGFGVVVSVAAYSAATQARDHGQYDHVQPAIKAWIESLQNELGVGCCATADGYRPEEVDWDLARDHYRVKIENSWIEVPDFAIIKGPNRIGFALVWLSGYLDENGKRVVRCFLPGPAS